MARPWQGIVARKFTPKQFELYVNGADGKSGIKMPLLGFRPVGVTVHHCGQPSLKQRPNDLLPEHMLNFQSFYRDEKKWSAGPHLFVDRTGIWVFTPLTVRGVHAESFNAKYWGLEMLGDYDAEEPNSDVLRNTYAAVGTLLRKIGKNEKAINFHRQDPQTSKTCPGRKINYAGFVARMAAELEKFKGGMANVPVTIEGLGSPTAGGPSLLQGVAYIPAGGTRAMAPLGELIKAVPEIFHSWSDKSAINSDELVVVATWLEERGYSYTWSGSTKTIKITGLVPRRA
jgi:hypothetical protein